MSSPTILLAIALARGDDCNFGPTHHSHLTLPRAASRDACKKQDATFFLSHGATFFCPHTYDVKLLATIVEDGARATLCDSHFDAVATGASTKHVLRPTLPAGGLPALAHGEMAEWTSHVMYHVHSFGTDNDAGPDAGWNVTTIRNATTTIRVTRVLYGRKLDIQPAPRWLTFLAHSFGTDDVILSHYISTSGESGFDAIVTGKVVGSAVTLREDWPLVAQFPGLADNLTVAESALTPGATVSATVLTYDERGLPASVTVDVTVASFYYGGASDGFAGFGTMCWAKPPAPQSPSTCVA